MPQRAEERGEAGLRASVRGRYGAGPVVARYRERVALGLRPWEEVVLARHHSTPGKVLVLGAGVGRESFALAERGHRVTAVDVSIGMLEAARDESLYRSLPARWVAADGAALPFARGSFDHVLGWSQVLAHVPGHEGRRAFLRGCRESLRAGGTLSFSVHDDERTAPQARDLIIAGPGERGLGERDYVMRDDETPCYWHYFDRAEIVALCEGVALEVTLCELASELADPVRDNLWICVASPAAEARA